MSQQQGRPATSVGSGQPRSRYGNATAASLPQQQQQQARTTTPTNSRTILDELLALGQLGELSSSAQLEDSRRRSRQRSPSEQPPNVTIIDYRDVAAPWHAPKEIVTPFDEFQSQWRSMAAAAGAATTTDGSGGGGGDSTTSSSATLALPPSAPVGAPGLAILDIRRTKTNRRKRRARSRDYENLGPPLYTGAESSGSNEEEDEDEDDAAGDDHLEEEHGVRTTGQQQQQQQPTTTTSQQARQQATGQQRQQSGETLSSFESDYDLLLYLGETETEDLVETERSLDYLDQTWRQSICGGASLAPTLDESLSDVLHHQHQSHSQQHDDFDQLWRPASGNGHALNRRGQQQQQQQVRARVTSNQNNLSPNQSAHSSASLPRHSDLTPSRASQQQQTTTSVQPTATTASGLRAHTLRSRATQLEYEQLTLVTGQEQEQQQPRQVASSKFVSLFNRESAEQPVDRAATRELDELLAREHAGQHTQTMGPPKPKRQRPYAPANFEAELPPPPPPGGADELDRLLAEMSQSLDLDSLARYDPHRGTRPTQAAHQQSQARPINRQVQPPPPQSSSNSNKMTTQNTWSQVQPARSSQATNKRILQTKKLYENQDREQPTTATTTTASSESILSDYDGASRMLEQMISDQLAETSAPLNPRTPPTPMHTTGAPWRDASRPVARSTKSKSSSTRSSDQENPTEMTTTTTTGGAKTKRKVSSTCSSSVATTTTTTTTRDESVIAARRDETEDEPPRYSDQSALWRHKQVMGEQPPIHQSESNLLAGGGGRKKRADPRLRNLKHSPNYSRSLDVEVAPEVGHPPTAAAGARAQTTITSNQQQKILNVRHESPSVHSSSRRSSTTTTTTTTTGDDRAENKVPPKPPAPDYGDFRPPPPSIVEVKTGADPPPPPSGQVIQVEAAEMSTSTTTSDSEQEDSAKGRENGASRHKKMISRMRRRTLTSMRQIRDRFGQFAGGAISPDKDQARVAAGPVEPEPPKRSSSIASSSRDGRGGSRGGGVPEPEVGVSPENASNAVASPRQSRQRERKGVPPSEPAGEHADMTGHRKSFGRQWRERLSRSKSRFTQFIRGDSSHRKRAQSTPDERRATAAQESVSFLLPQPSDIARNERNTQESSLERHLKASLVNEVTAPIAPVALSSSPAQRKVSTSSNRSLSSDLSGLETTATKGGGRRFERPARRASRSSGKRKSGAPGEPSAEDQPTGRDRAEENSRKRPASLISLKRFSESIGKMTAAAAAAPPKGSAEDLEELESAALRAKRKRAGKRQRNKSSGARLMYGSSPPSSPTDQLVNQKRATTDDYFGLVAPLRTPGDEPVAHPVTPVSSVHQRVEMGPKVRPASVLLKNGENFNGRFAFRRNRKLPDRSQSLKSQSGDAVAARRVLQGTRSVAESHENDNEQATSAGGDSANVAATHQKAVSFHNLATPQTGNHQRRQLSPVAPNTFRPASAASQVVATPPTQTLTASTLEITDVRYADSPITLVQPISGANLRLESPQPPPPPPPPAVTSVTTTSMRTSARRSPMHERGATLLGDIKSKYNELFSKAKTTSARSKSTDQPLGLAVQPPPHRPPRRRNRKSPSDKSSAAELPRRSKSLAAAPRCEVRQPPEDGESGHFIELAPASPPLSLGPLSVTPSESPQPQGATLTTTTQRPAKRLASFASQLRNSAVDFFNAAGPNSAQRKPPSAPSPQPPTLAAATAAAATPSTVNERPKHFATRNLDEPMLQRDLAQWRPIIPSTRGGANSGATGVKRSASFRLPKDPNVSASIGAQEDTKPDYQKGHTLASGQLRSSQQQQQQQKSLDDSDSTWDSESGSEHVESASKIVQGAQQDRGAIVVHDDGDESPPPSRRRAATSEQQAQVFAASEAQSAKGGIDGGGSETSAAHHASVAPTSGKLPATILQGKSAASISSSSSEQRAATSLGVDEQENRGEEKLKTSGGGGGSGSLRNDQNNNIRRPESDKTKALEPQVPQSLVANQSDELSLVCVGGNLTNKLTDLHSKPQHQQQQQQPSVTNEGQPLVVCSNHCPLPRKPSDNSTTGAAAPNVQLFKFKDILPSPEQILEERRWRERRDQQKRQQQVAPGASARERKQRPTPVARANQAEQEPLSQATDEELTGNRLSIYENVNLGEQIGEREQNESLTQDTKETNQQEEARDQETKILKNLKQDLNVKAMTQDDTRENLTTNLPPARPAAIGVTSSRGQKPAPPPRPKQTHQQPQPARDESDWSVEEPDERLIERMSAKVQEQVVADQQRVVAAELVRTSPSQSSPQPPPQYVTATREPPKRKLISMTSIIQEPEDELMNRATVQVVAPPMANSGEQVVDLSWPRAGPESQSKFPRAQDPRRDSALFERCNDSDDSDSSLAAPAQSGRKRLLDKLRGQSGSAGGATAAAANEPAKRPPNLPRATGGGGAGSLVKRLARNFDQTVQDQPASLSPLARRSPALNFANSPAASSRSPQAPPQQQPPVTGARRPLPGRLSFELDEPKSDSTWYDAKSAELLDEAEVAELLREFESDGLPPGGNGGLQSQSTDQFVSVANDSTLSHEDDDERGRRDEPRARAGGDLAGGGGGGGDSDDPTLNDDQTLDDDDNDDDENGTPLVDEEAPPTEESESVYASLATEPTHNSRSVAGPSAGGGDQQQSPSSTSKGKDRGELDTAARSSGSRENSPARPALHVAAESPANSAVASGAHAADASAACNLIADGGATSTAATACPATTACDERVACTQMQQQQQQQRQQRGESITPTSVDCKVNDNVAPCCSPSSSSSRELAANKNKINKCSRLSQPQHPQLPHDPEPPRPESVDAAPKDLARRADGDVDDDNQTDDIDREQKLRQQFKQSLNNIISQKQQKQQKQQQQQARRPDSGQFGRTKATISTSGGGQQMRVATADPSETQKDPPEVPLEVEQQQQQQEEDESSRTTTTTSGKKATQQQQQQKSSKCCKKASSLAKEISKCYKALIGASDLAVKGKQQVLQTEQARLEDVAERTKDQQQPPVESVQVEQQVASPLRDSVQSQATLSSRAHSGDDDEQQSEGEGDEDEDEEDFQLNTKNLVQAAKKCSQLYEELERLLQVRAAKQRKKSSEAGGDEADEEEEEEEEDVDEESLLADLISEQSSQRGDDVISLSSSSLSSESLPELRQRKNLQKLYNIVNEICTSEEKFVATLKLLNEDFRRHVLDGRWATGAGATPCDLAHLHAHAHAYKVNLQQAPFDCIGLVLKHLPQLQALNESLLEELKRAREQWPSTQKISHVLVKIGPFLKHYSSYIRDFEQIQAQFQENLKKSSHFRLAIQTFEASPATSKLNAGKLSVQHHLLKPIQRIPQYRLLLQQYLHHLKPDDADYEDTVEALEVVSRVAEHANQSLSEGANFAKLLALQAKIVGKQRDIIQPGRLFVKEGELLKVCRKQIQPCWFVLLNDSLLYLKQIQSSDILYLKYELPLDDCQVDLASAERTCPLASSTTLDDHSEQPLLPSSVKEEKVETATTDRGGENLERDRQFNVCTTVRSMTLIAKSRQERDEWLTAMRAAIGDQVAKRQSFKSASSRSRLLVANADQADNDQTTTAARLDQIEREQQQRERDASEALSELVGRKAPIWTPDSRVTRCESCTSNFSALFRRHHCRACGRVVCSACSSNRAPLIYLKCRAARVCDHCFESLRANMHLYYLPSCPIDERELKRLDEHFKTLLKAQFTRERPAHHKQRKHKKPQSLTQLPQPPLASISPAPEPSPDTASAQATDTNPSGVDNTQVQ